MTAEKAIEVLNTYDMSEDNEDKEFIEAIQTAIQSLKSWEKVKKEIIGFLNENQFININYLLENIINKHLQEVEE